MTCEELVGKTIASVDMADDKGAIRFTLADGLALIYEAYGDCCSSTWIESIDSPEVLKGATVRGVEALETDSRNDPEHDFLQIYGVKITTDKGMTTLDFRNSSNGYYGGSLDLTTRPDKHEWQPLE